MFENLFVFVDYEFELKGGGGNRGLASFWVNDDKQCIRNTYFFLHLGIRERKKFEVESSNSCTVNDKII